jgi:hypothetical protein
VGARRPSDAKSTGAALEPAATPTCRCSERVAANPARAPTERHPTGRDKPRPLRPLFADNFLFVLPIFRVLFANSQLDRANSPQPRRSMNLQLAAPSDGPRGCRNLSQPLHYRPLWARAPVASFDPPLDHRVRPPSPPPRAWPSGRCGHRLGPGRDRRCSRRTARRPSRICRPFAPACAAARRPAAAHGPARSL